MSEIVTLLKQHNIILLDGGTGTQLQYAHGLELPAPLWSSHHLRANPDKVQAVHEDFLRAGVQLVTTATFRSNPNAYQEAGLSVADSRRDTILAVKLARNAIDSVGSSALVLGSVTSVGDCYDHKILPYSLLWPNHQAQAQALKDGGADAVVFETVPTGTEAQLMNAAAIKAKIPAILSFTVGENGYLLDHQTTLADVEEATRHPNRIAIGVNCSRFDNAEAAIRNLLSSGYRDTIIIYPNGISDTEGPKREDPNDLGWQFSADGRVDAARSFVAKALNLVEDIRRHGNTVIIGGCCGITSIEIRLLSQSLADRFPGYRSTAHEVSSSEPVGPHSCTMTCHTHKPANTLDS